MIREQTWAILFRVFLWVHIHMCLLGFKKQKDKNTIYLLCLWNTTSYQWRESTFSFYLTLSLSSHHPSLIVWECGVGGTTFLLCSPPERHHCLISLRNIHKNERSLGSDSSHDKIMDRAFAKNKSETQIGTHWIVQMELLGLDVSIQKQS